MPLTFDDWNEIMDRVGRMIGRSTNFFEQGKVIRRDINKRLVWLQEFGDQPIPVIGFNYEVKIYDTQPTGNTTAVGTPVKSQTAVRTYTVTPATPKVGDLVLVAKQMGTRRLPKCLGVIQSRDYVMLAEE